MTALAERRTICIRMEALDGTIARVAAQYPQNLTMSNGEVYLGGQFTTTSTRSTVVDGGPSTIDLGFTDSADTATRAEIESGKWDNASVYEFATDWANPVEDEEEINLYTLGKVEDVDGVYTVQMMGLKDKLGQRVGRTHTPSCLWTFADNHLDTGIIATDKSRCKLSAASFTVTGTLTSVTSAEEFADSARSEADDYFGNGEIIFTSGLNAGLSRRNVKSFSGGAIKTNAPFYYLPQVGDSYTMIAGCRKRGKEDCTGKFSNRKRFGGFSYVPTKSQVTKFGNQ